MLHILKTRLSHRLSQMKELRWVFFFSFLIFLDPTATYNFQLSEYGYLQQIRIKDSLGGSDTSINWNTPADTDTLVGYVYSWQIQIHIPLGIQIPLLIWIFSAGINTEAQVHKSDYIPSDFGNDSEKILYEDICICDDLVLGLVKIFEQALVIQCVPQW